jgi:hypothetical protein
MTDIANCRALELMCLRRAKSDPEHSWKWLGQADRWHSLGKREAAWRFQRMPQQMHAGAMEMGPYTVRGDSRWKQQG